MAELVTADIPLGPNKAVDRLGVRRVEADWTVKLKWIRVVEWAAVQYGTSRAGAVEAPLYRTADIDALSTARPEADWEELRQVEKGRRSPLAALRPKRRRHRCRNPALRRGGHPEFPGGRPFLMRRTGRAGMETVRLGWSM
ncbi:hypothetical protein [Streptomyces sp. bgisy095]|uniref:hypothetical protein n=1 Tax=unclassified Streptomyces TaxID=2593676 RepID=UPI003D74D556